MSLVYVMARDGRPVYVGQCLDLKKRLLAHRVHEYDCIWYQETEDRAALERHLIRTLRPPLNTALNPDKFKTVLRDTNLAIRVNARERKLLDASAEADDRTLSDWARRALLEASDLRKRRKA